MNIIEKANAKINLFLDIVGRRQDGYHLLETIMHTIPLCDIVKISASKNGIALSGSTNTLSWDRTNLAYRAAEKFCSRFNVPCDVSIYIEKHIPIAAGLGGGSADAAAVLRGLNKFYGLNVDNQHLREIALELGADVPYCIEGGTVLAEGIGEKLTCLPTISEGYVLLAVPPIAISTAEIYNKWDVLDIKPHSDIGPVIEAIEEKNLPIIGKHLFNTLEAVTTKCYPIISQIERVMMLNGCLGSCMSGSGPSVFGLFDELIKAEKCRDKLQNVTQGGVTIVLPISHQEGKIC